ncbi:MAG TPA: VOC family protein [Mycobacteriales bacterium]|nr:VOC family protein [Mycobacteriales bacterium]
MALPRLRQAVLASADLEATCRRLEAELAVSAPFHDAGVEHYGLGNAVYALGNTFVEVVSPVREGTAAGRQIDRAGGDCGYMCMFELADEEAVRRRVAAAGVRVVHDEVWPHIVDLHLHPKDVPGAIVALDVTDPVGSWRWGGPAWEGAAFAAAAPEHRGEGLRGLTVAVRDPVAAARRWGELLGVVPDTAGLWLDGGAQRVEFRAAADGVERIVEVHAAVVGRGGEATVAGVRFVRTEI